MVLDSGQVGNTSEAENNDATEVSAVSVSFPSDPEEKSNREAKESSDSLLEGGSTPPPAPDTDLDKDPEPTPLSLIHNNKKGKRRPPMQRMGLLSALDLKNALKDSNDEGSPHNEAASSSGSARSVSDLLDDPDLSHTSEPKEPMRPHKSKEKKPKAKSRPKEPSEESEISFNSDDSESPVASPRETRERPKRPKSTIEQIEDSILGQLNDALSYLKRTFIDEFRDLVDAACGIDRPINACLSELQRDLRELFDADSSAVVLPTLDVSSYFDQLQGTIPRNTTTSGDPRPDDASVIQQLKTNGVRFLDDSRALLNELTSERAQVMQLRAELGTDSDAQGSKRAMADELETRSLQIDWERQHVERLVQEMRVRVIEQRERGMMLIKDSGEEGEPGWRADLETITESLREMKGRDAISRAKAFGAKGRSSTDEIVVMAGQLWARVGRFSKVMAIISQPQPPMPFEAQPVQYVQVQPPPMERQSVVDSVQVRLAEIRKRRAATMRGVREITAELAADI